MKIAHKQPNLVKLIEILPGETFKLISGIRIFIKITSISNSNVNAISLDSGEGFFISNDISVIKVEGEFVEK